MAGKVVDRRPVVRKKLLPGQGVGPIAKPLQKCNDEPRAGGHLAERDHYDDLDRGSHMDDEQDRKPTAFSFPPQAFDPRKEYSVVERRLPHWSQAGAIAFITWRTWDSMPAKGIDTWLAGRDEILKRLGAPVVISLREMKGILRSKMSTTKRHCRTCRDTCAGRQAGGGLTGPTAAASARNSARKVCESRPSPCIFWPQTLDSGVYTDVHYRPPREESMGAQPRLGCYRTQAGLRR